MNYFRNRKHLLQRVSCLFLSLCILVSSAVAAPAPVKVKPAVQLKAQPFALQDVRLLPSRFTQAMEINKEYLLKLDPARLLWPYYDRAGIPVKGERYGGWEKKDVVGQTTGHYLSALALMFASTGDAEIKRRVDFMVDEIAMVQKKHGNGYAGPVRTVVWSNTFDGTIEVGKWALGTGYVPWYVLHKTYAALIDAYLFAGNTKALKVVCAFADWAKKNTDTLSDEQFQDMLRCEYGGMNESMANLYAITGNKDYLDLARRFNHKSIIDPLAEKRDELKGKHVNTQLPKLIGVARLYELTGDERYATIARYLWEQVINKRAFVQGGIELQEHFFGEGEECDHLGWNSAETCSVYNMLKLTREIFGWEPEAEYMDYYERALYNQILGSQDPDSGGMTYFYSLKPGHFKIYSTPFDAMWCCVGTGIENHSKYGDTIYYHNDKDLWVNLFIPSILKWEEKQLSVKQETKFPEEDTTTLTISTKKPQKFAVNIRVPYWAFSGADVRINGKKQKVKAKPQSYLTLSRTWKDGDTISVRLPMSVHVYRARDKENLIALLYGPTVLAGELGREGMPENDNVNHNKTHSNMLPPPVPVLLTDGKNPAKWVKRIKGPGLKFKTVGVGKPNDVTLIPLYDMHHQRYTVYWETMTKGEWRARPKLSPTRVNAEKLAPGVAYTYYEGAWKNLPEFGKLSPVKKGVADSFDISAKNQKDNFGFVFSGYLKIDTAGDYSFGINSDDGCRMKIGGKEIVFQDGIGIFAAKPCRPITMKPGYYPIEVSFFEGMGGEHLEVNMYGGSSDGWQRIGKDQLYRNKQ